MHLTTQYTDACLIIAKLANMQNCQESKIVK